MWLHNNIHTQKIQAYNEKPITRGTGGLTVKEDYATIDLRVLIVPTVGRFRRAQTGKFEEMFIHFQVSKSELNKKNFTVEIGVTHVIVNSIDYRVTQIQSAAWMNTVQLYDCLAVRQMPVEELT